MTGRQRERLRGTGRQQSPELGLAAPKPRRYHPVLRAGEERGQRRWTSVGSGANLLTSPNHLTLGKRDSVSPFGKWGNSSAEHLGLLGGLKIGAGGGVPTCSQPWRY